MERLPWWLPLVARAVTVVGLAGPMVEKFINYSGQVAFFRRLGIPMPEIMVPFAGAVELAALLMIGLGLAGRLGALGLLGNMVVVIATAGLNLLSGLVTLGALAVLGLGTGRFSLWSGETALLARLRR